MSHSFRLENVPAFGNHQIGILERCYARGFERKHIRTLKTLSFRRVTESLLENRYSPSVCNGPFTVLPSSIINQLFTEVSESQDFSVFSLLPIVRSGHMTKLQLTFCSRISAEDFVVVCHAMVPFAASLTEILINMFHPLSVSPKECTRALEKLLSIARELKTLKTTIPFNLGVVRTLKLLEHLEVNVFTRKFEPKIKKSIFQTKNTLQYVYIDHYGKQTLKRKDVAVILSGCPQLLELRNDLAETMEFLHRSSPSSQPRYKLRNAVLGSGNFLYGACKRHVELAASTCPDIAELDLYTEDNQALTPLCKMKHLHTLRVTWVGKKLGDFQEVLLPPLRAVGHQLRRLFISGFLNVDFNALLSYGSGSLVELELYIRSVMDTDEMKKSILIRMLDRSDLACFSKLQSIKVSLRSLSKEETDALCDIIFNRAPRLQRLDANVPLSFLIDRDPSSAPHLHPHLSHVALYGCTLSAFSIISFVRLCPSLDTFSFTAYPELTTAQQEQIRSELRPSTILCCLGLLKWKILKLT